LTFICDCGAEFADLTFDEMRSMYLMNGEQNCSATKGNHVLTDVELPTEVCPSEYLEILHVLLNHTCRGYEGLSKMIRATIIRADSIKLQNVHNYK
jgi:hypothetical protein